MTPSKSRTNTSVGSLGRGRFGAPPTATVPRRSRSCGTSLASADSAVPVLCTQVGCVRASSSPAPPAGANQQVHHLRSPLWLRGRPGSVDVPSAVGVAGSAGQNPRPCSECSARGCPAAHTLLAAAAQGLLASGPRPAAAQHESRRELSRARAQVRRGLEAIPSASTAVATARPLPLPFCKIGLR